MVQCLSLLTLFVVFLSAESKFNDENTTLLSPLSMNDTAYSHNPFEMCSNDFEQISSEFKCDCAHQTKQARDGIINYFSINYCYMNSGVLRVVWVFILVAWLLFLFYVIARTTDCFLVPALAIGVEALAISPNIAGVTILAFANGAPDLFTAIAAFSGESTDEDMGLGSLLGGGMFLTAFTLGTVAIISQDFSVPRRPLLRDVLAYSIGLGFLLYITLDGKVYLWESCLLIVVYFVYVLVVIVGRYIYKNFLRPRNIRAQVEKRNKSELLSNCELEVADSAPQAGRTAELKPPSSTHTTDFNTIQTPCSIEDIVQSNQSQTNSNVDSDCSNTSDIATSKYERCSTVSMRTFEEHPRGCRMSLCGDNSSCYSQKDVECASERSFISVGENVHRPLITDFRSVARYITAWDHQSKFGKFLVVLEFPIIVLRRLTVPCIEDATWHRELTALSISIGPVAAMAIVFRVHSYLPYIISGVIGVIGGTIVYCFTERTKPPSSKALLLFLVGFAFVFSSLWTFVIANELVAVMQNFGLSLGVTSGVLGVTVLAWGNSIGDYVSDVALAKSKHSRMAAAECYGGPIFNLMIAAGVSFLMAGIENYPDPVDLSSSRTSAVVGYSFIFLLASIAYTAVLLPLRGFVLDRAFGLGLVGLYLVFMIAAILAEVHVLPPIFG